MSQKFFFLILAIGTMGLAGCCCFRPGQPMTNPSADDVAMKVPFKIGGSIVHAQFTRHGRGTPTLINVHDDENTSVVAGKIVIEQTGGRLIELTHSGRRNIRFNLNGEQFAFDPNRIFSDAGIRDTLERQSTYSEAAHRAVKQFATQWLEYFALDQQPNIIALHNNSEGSLSIHSYQPGGEHADAAVAVYVAAQRDPDDFFYVTDQRFFDYLKARNFNVLLQDNANVPDDGSLSVYFARKKIPYVNIEAESDHLNAQIEMVRVALEMYEELITTSRAAVR